jgi:hypothetical protein
MGPSSMFARKAAIHFFRALMIRWCEHSSIEWRVVRTFWHTMDEHTNHDEDVHEFILSDKISQGSIVAVVASPNEFWLVFVKSSCGPANYRWLGIWLDKAPVKRIRGGPQIDGILYNVAQGCDEACFWQDTILCDLTIHMRTHSEDAWILPYHINSQVEQLLSRQSHVDNSVQPPFCSIPRPHIQIESSTSTCWDTNTVQNLVDKCSQALSLV